MRRIRQPGSEAPERIQWVAARGRAFPVRLEAGRSLLEAAHAAFRQAGFEGGMLNIDGGALGPLAYVMPALSRTGEHAAFYSDAFRPAGVTTLTRGAMTLGLRDGAPFFHCHALWTEADGRRSGGHILPEETIVAEPFGATAFGLDGASFVAEADAETNFRLFGPLPSNAKGAPADRHAFALRLRPNQDLSEALVNFCRDRGIVRAMVHGGVGSTIGARFIDGRKVEPFATELAITSGFVGAGDDGSVAAHVDVALVDYTGGIHEGRLLAGDNPVLMTMELVLEVI
jgi:predicted DNA-binding protein with PD1-like motif